ncbi:MAG: hypothetical protein RRY36_07780 [Bacteroidaceae bacterium]
MKTNILQSVNTYLSDNKQSIAVSGCTTIAEYLIRDLNEDSDYALYLTSGECEFDITGEKKEEVKNWIEAHFESQLINK